MAALKLSSGDLALVDNEDFELVAQYTWFLFVSRGHPYVCAWVEGQRVFLHRFITQAPKGVYVDHKDGDGLNNRRANLRRATQGQNAANQRLSKANTSGFKGVSRNGRNWLAQTKVGGKYMYLGTYRTPEEAAQAYDATVIELHGPYARTNASLGLIQGGCSVAESIC